MANCYWSVQVCHGCPDELMEDYPPKTQTKVGKKNYRIKCLNIKCRWVLTPFFSASFVGTPSKVCPLSPSTWRNINNITFVFLVTLSTGKWILYFHFSGPSRTLQNKFEQKHFASINNSQTYNYVADQWDLVLKAPEPLHVQVHIHVWLTPNLWQQEIPAEQLNGWIAKERDI